ncbi:MAG: DUF1428 domain-containing protein [Hyphomonadaceae bacterium]|nr:DUF1428 domain-containing protein [Hyphomonadaceae bacterium]
MSYTQGFIIPVPASKKQDYIKLAEASGEIFREYGATRIVENWAENLPDGKVTDFNRAVKAEDGEAIVFSWMEWPDKATCDAAADKMQADERFAKMGEMPFDGKRMIYAGFDPIYRSEG